jgi:hypothetical protein
MRAYVAIPCLLLAACAPRSNDVEAQLHALEAEVAALRATVLPGRVDPAEPKAEREAEPPRH